MRNKDELDQMIIYLDKIHMIMEDSGQNILDCKKLLQKTKNGIDSLKPKEKILAKMLKGLKKLFAK